MKETMEKGSMEGARKTNLFAALGPAGAIISAILASLFCLGPFVLVMLGVSGAWIGQLRSFEPYRPIFILLTIDFLGTDKLPLDSLYGKCRVLDLSSAGKEERKISRIEKI